MASRRNARPEPLKLMRSLNGVNGILIDGFLMLSPCPA